MGSCCTLRRAVGPGSECGGAVPPVRASQCPVHPDERDVAAWRRLHGSMDPCLVVLPCTNLIHQLHSIPEGQRAASVTLPSASANNKARQSTLGSTPATPDAAPVPPGSCKRRSRLPHTDLTHRSLGQVCINGERETRWRGPRGGPGFAAASETFNASPMTSDLQAALF